MLDKPLQSMLISGEKSRDKVMLGHKTTTLRFGWRDYQLGFVLSGCHLLNWCVGAQIIDVGHFIFKDVPLRLLKKNGYKDFDEAMSEMKKLYPTIEPMSKVTWVEWERS